MNIRVLFDNKSSTNSFLIGWGSSYLIDNDILFDTGEKSGFLFNNMKQMGINVNDINTVVISHEHFDHSGGLWDILQKKHGLDLYIPSKCSKEFKNATKSYPCNVIEVNSLTEIKNGVFVTGQFKQSSNAYRVAEQAMVVSTEKGLTIITGCAHDGIITILEYVMSNIEKNIYLIMGGFHLLDEPIRKIKEIGSKFKEAGVKYLGPCQCTGEDAVKVFRELYSDRLLDIEIGKTIRV